MEKLTAQSEERLNFRLEPAKKLLIERAARIKGLSLTDFAVTALVQEALEVIKGEEVLVLSDHDRDRFLSALESPPAPNRALRSAARAYQRKAREDAASHPHSRPKKRA